MLVSHVGVLPRPSALEEVLAAEGASQAEFERVLSGAVMPGTGANSGLLRAGPGAGRWLPAAGRPPRAKAHLDVHGDRRDDASSTKSLPTPG